MSEAKHTPGNWKVSGNSIVTSNDQFCIATIEDDGGYEAPAEQREANAIAIAAVPELLAAFNQALKEMEFHDSEGPQIFQACIEAARAALTKAQPL